MKLVGKSYPFPNGRYLLTFDNHNSVNGIREFARRGAEVTYIPIALPDMRVDRSQLDRELRRPSKRRSQSFCLSRPIQLFLRQASPRWIERAITMAGMSCWTPGFCPHQQTGSESRQTGFVSISFYKMFGYPTGVGVDRAQGSISKTASPWFAGGTITVASVQGDKYYMADGASAFEDGTIDYLNIPAVEIGLKHLEAIGYDVIGERVRSLTGWLLDNLTSLKHGNGVPLVRVYGPTDWIGAAAR